jgi:predicted transcriptional regulator
MTDELMSKRVSVVLADDVGEILEEMAKEERRSHSQMGAILIEEAIAARIAQQNGTPASGTSSGKGMGGKAGDSK